LKTSRSTVTQQYQSQHLLDNQNLYKINIVVVRYLQFVVRNIKIYANGIRVSSRSIIFCMGVILTGCYESDLQTSLEIRRDLGFGTNAIEAGKYSVRHDGEENKGEINMDRTEEGEYYYYDESTPNERFYFLHLAENIYLLQAHATEKIMVHLIFMKTRDGGVAKFPMCDDLPTKIKTEHFGKETLFHCNAESAKSIVELISQTDMRNSQNINLVKQ